MQLIWNLIKNSSNIFVANRTGNHHTLCFKLVNSYYFFSYNCEKVWMEYPASCHCLAVLVQACSSPALSGALGLLLPVILRWALIPLMPCNLLYCFAGLIVACTTPAHSGAHSLFLIAIPKQRSVPGTGTCHLGPAYTARPLDAYSQCSSSCIFFGRKR